MTGSCIGPTKNLNAETTMLDKASTLGSRARRFGLRHRRKRWSDPTCFARWACPSRAPVVLARWHGMPGTPRPERRLKQCNWIFCARVQRIQDAYAKLGALKMVANFAPVAARNVVCMPVFFRAARDVVPFITACAAYNAALNKSNHEETRWSSRRLDLPVWGAWAR